MTPAEARAAMLAEGALELRNGQLDLTPQGQRALDAFLAELPTLQKMFDVFTRHPTLTIEGYDRPDRPALPSRGWRWPRLSINSSVRWRGCGKCQQ